MTDEATAFALAPYEDKTLAEGVQLYDFKGLIGQTIKAIVSCPGGKNAPEGAIVIVTETLCWAVLDAPYDSFGDSPAVIRFAPTFGDSIISDYLSSHDMLQCGLITPAQFAFFSEKEREERRQDAAQRLEQAKRRVAELEAEANA